MFQGGRADFEPARQPSTTQRSATLMGGPGLPACVPQESENLKSEQDAMKKAVGEEAATFVQDGQVVGLGTGSTAEHAIHALARRVQGEEIHILGIPTSARSEELAKKSGIQLTTLEEHPEVDITIDGADEVDRDWDLVKGGGGALTREKIVAAATKKEVIVVDDSKLVDVLGKAFPLPVELVPMALGGVRAELEIMGAKVERRMKGGKPFKTDNQMAILDCRFPQGIGDKKDLERDINLIPGVLENGLFLGLTHEVLVGTPDGVLRLEPGKWIDQK